MPRPLSPTQKLPEAIQRSPAGTVISSWAKGTSTRSAGPGPSFGCAGRKRFDDYEARAIALAKDPAGLAELRIRLQQALVAAPLFDTGRFCRALERAFDRIWQRHAQG